MATCPICGAVLGRTAKGAGEGAIQRSMLAGTQALFGHLAEEHPVVMSLLGTAVGVLLTNIIKRLMR